MTAQRRCTWACPGRPQGERPDGAVRGGGRAVGAGGGGGLGGAANWCMGFCCAGVAQGACAVWCMGLCEARGGRAGPLWRARGRRGSVAPARRSFGAGGGGGLGGAANWCMGLCCAGVAQGGGRTGAWGFARRGVACLVGAEGETLSPQMNADRNFGAGGRLGGWHRRSSRHQRSSAFICGKRVLLAG